MPPASLLGLSELSGFDIRLTPASKVWDWLQAEILADTGSIHNEDHAHLIDADIRVMWASAAFSKKGRTVVGQAEQVAFRAGGWQKARMEQQMFDWFGCLPTYIITQPVTSLPSVNRGSLSADRAGGHQEQTGMSHAIISSIYEVKLIAWNAARSEKLKIVFENTAYTPAAGETYLRAFTIPGDTASNTLGGDHRLFTGVFQVSIIAPAGTGKENTNPVAAELTDLFPLYARDTKGDVTVVTMSPVESAPGITGDSTYTAPVSFMSQQAVAARPGHV